MQTAKDVKQYRLDFIDMLDALQDATYLENMSRQSKVVPDFISQDFWNEVEDRFGTYRDTFINDVVFFLSDVEASVPEEKRNGSIREMFVAARDKVLNGTTSIIKKHAQVQADFRTWFLERLSAEFSVTSDWSAGLPLMAHDLRMKHFSGQLTTLLRDMNDEVRAADHEANFPIL